MRSNHSLLVYLLFIALLLIPSPGSADSSAGNFVVFDATQYRGKPDLSVYGIKPLPIVYGHFLWKDRRVKANLPDPFFVKQVVNQDRYRSAYLCLDVEHWPIDTGKSIAASIHKYRSLLRTVREVRPEAQIGYYGIPPKRDYFASIAHQSSERYLAWHKINTRLAALGADIDIVFPSLYTFYNKPAEWRRYAISCIEASRAYNKPVFPFLWPQYHESNRLRGHMYIDPDFWALQLQTLAQHADGLVIWGGWDFKSNRPAEWDEKAEWWQVTKRFIIKK